MGKDKNVAAMSALWWSILGGALFTAGATVMAISYSTMQLIAAAPSTTSGAAISAVSSQAFALGIIGAGIGLIILVVGRLLLVRVKM